jgi:hypothetical protein
MMPRGTIKLYGGGTRCHGWIEDIGPCKEELPEDPEGREGWFIKMSTIFCPTHHPDHQDK